MELTDRRLISLLGSPSVRVRSAALETLAAAYCEDAAMLRAVFDAWDRYGIETAFPELTLINHLPVSSDLADESLLRAAEMSRVRKLTDPVCRAAGKLMEAYSVAQPEAYERHFVRFQGLRRESKIFFRVDVDAMQLRIQATGRPSLQLQARIDRLEELPEGEDPEIDAVRAAIDELLNRGEASAIINAAIFDLQASDRGHSQLTSVCCELMTRRCLAGFEPSLVALLAHPDSHVADAAAIGLIRCRSAAVLRGITEAFPTLVESAQLRAAAVLQRLRLPETAVEIRKLRAGIDSRPVAESLLVAEVLQFDFGLVEDWLEAMLTVDDQHLARIQSRMHLAIPLAADLPEDVQPRFMSLLRSRFASSL